MMFKMSAMFMVFHVFVSMVIPWKAMNYTASYFVLHFRSHPTAVFSSSKAESPFTRESHASPWERHGELTVLQRFLYNFVAPMLRTVR